MTTVAAVPPTNGEQRDAAPVERSVLEQFAVGGGVDRAAVPEPSHSLAAGRSPGSVCTTMLRKSAWPRGVKLRGTISKERRL
jgi:hypothetical protein